MKAAPSLGKLLRDAQGSSLASGSGSIPPQMETRQPAQEGLPISETIFDSLHFSFAYSSNHATIPVQTAIRVAKTNSLEFRLRHILSERSFRGCITFPGPGT